MSQYLKPVVSLDKLCKMAAELGKEIQTQNNGSWVRLNDETIWRRRENMQDRLYYLKRRRNHERQL